MALINKNNYNSIFYPFLKVLIFIIYIISHIYDYLTYPLWCLIQKPWRVLAHGQGIHSNWEETEDGIVFRNKMEDEDIYSRLDTMDNVEDYDLYSGLDTMDQVCSYAVGLYQEEDCLGTRQIVGEEEVELEDGKVLIKYQLGEYQWSTYQQFGERVGHFGRGMRRLGVSPGEKVVILAETRSDWITAAFGCFEHSIVLVTLYTNLGDDGIVHGISETQVSTVICSHETLEKVVQVLDRVPLVTNLIVMSDLSGKELGSTASPDSVNIISFDDCVDLGYSNEGALVSPCPPSPSDIAIVMYTSGSTGVPKGVMLSHRNLVSGLKSLSTITTFEPGKDRYIGYLPLAHVLELLAETCCLVNGVKIGYSSPLTLTNKSGKVGSGSKGDVNVLQPTLICAVPLILERIYKSIEDTMKRQGWFAEELFHYLVRYKKKWQDRGFDTPLLNKTLFRKIRYFLGGRVRLMLSGGAPFSPDTHSLTRTCLCVPLLQGYGLTETTSSATVMAERDRTTGRAGAPLVGVHIKLVDWEEGDYLVKDKPNPRGEIHVGGDNVAEGYFGNKEATDSEFYEKDGKRWFRTGDIGEFDKDGVLRIIDRKKDLVKLQAGEYVSYGKVESVLKTAPVVENICAYGDPSKEFIVAIVVPDKAKLNSLEAARGMHSDASVNCAFVIEEIVRQVKEHGSKNGLKKFEIPARILVVNDEWTPESGLVTAAFKIRRKFVYAKYKKDLDALYNL